MSRSSPQKALRPFRPNLLLTRVLLHLSCLKHGWYLSSWLMFTPTESWAAKMSVMRTRNCCRISFREVHLVWTYSHTQSVEVSSPAAAWWCTCPASTERLSFANVQEVHHHGQVADGYSSPRMSWYVLWSTWHNIVSGSLWRLVSSSQMASWPLPTCDMLF